MKLSILDTVSILALVAAVALTGCEAPTSALVDTESTELLAEYDASTDLTTVLTEELSLSASQQDSVKTDVQRHGGTDVAPGSLWYLSARLQGFLTERQKAKLFRVAERLQQGHLHKLVGVYAPCVVDRPDVDDDTRRILFHLIADLISDDQRAEIEELRARYGEQIHAIHEQLRAGEITREEAEEAVRALHDALSEEIRSLLSDDQLAALLERIAAGDEAHDAFLEHQRAAMIEALDLTDDQVAELDEQHRTQCAAVEGLVDEVHGGEITREEFRNGLARLVDAKQAVYARLFDEVQSESATIHDALLIINARRYVHHVAGGPHRPGAPDRRPGPGARPAPDSRPGPAARPGPNARPGASPSTSGAQSSTD